jgi:hypothetical protein
MPCITVDVDVDLEEFTDEEMIADLECRGYKIVKESDQVLEREDVIYLIELLDKNENTWYTRRIRDKLVELRFTKETA